MLCICGQDFEPRQTGGRAQEYCSTQCADRMRKQLQREREKLGIIIPKSTLRSTSTCKPRKRLVDLKINEQDEYIVYGLLDPTDYLFHYIGMTRDVYERFRQHIGCHEDNQYKNEWIQQLGRKGLRPHLVLIETSMDPYQIKMRESYWIRYYIEERHPLLNIAENLPGRQHSLPKKGLPS